MDTIEIRYTLIADGSSDKSLKSIIDWTLDDLFPGIVFNGVFADFRSLPDPPVSLSEKIHMAEVYYPFHILFVHRDAESIEPYIIEQRKSEIAKSLNEKQSDITVCVIPVKMMETWLLIDKEAIKKAAGNRNYHGTLELPKIKNLESEAEPKQLLHQLLKEACGLKGRNLKKFNPHKHIHLLADYIQDYSPLRKLAAFKAFENEQKIKIEVFTKD